VANESILISEVIPASPQRIFSAWLDSAEHTAFTGTEATVVPAVGGEHRSAGGYIQGRTLELQEGTRIVQSWRTTEFPPESPDSRLEITLEPTLGGTLVTLLHTDIPSGQSDRYKQSWSDSYLSRLKMYFAEVFEAEEDETALPTGPVVSTRTRTKIDVSKPRAKAARAQVPKGEKKKTKKVAARRAARRPARKAAPMKKAAARRPKAKAGTRKVAKRVVKKTAKAVKKTARKPTRKAPAKKKARPRRR
jgi:uncharacterized protein YndB with AHSA1/START domain